MANPVEVIVDQLRAIEDREYDHPKTELGRELTAGVISNRRWLYRHPIDSSAWPGATARSGTPGEPSDGCKGLGFAG